MGGIQTYTLAGRQFGSHTLAWSWLALLFGGSYLAVSGGSKKPATTPPINASSPEESDFIKQFMAQAEAEDKKGGH